MFSSKFLAKHVARLLNFATQNFFIAKIEANMKRCALAKTPESNKANISRPTCHRRECSRQAANSTFFQSQKAECKRRTFIYLFVHSAGEHRHQYKCQDSISPPLDIRRMFELISGGLHPGKKQHPDITPHSRRGCQLQNHATLAES
jgi:hypothetical protein